ncbi:hypothetical protein SLNWT_7243 [Streptomyces albus]|uniref:SWF or SNF family helicase n=1 Tax=Streptomyces albus (strain ATCC 21838 / DSM 41398 / FERM P-419 / JCM 4703 / NBRC 107858) TaxID=1081613 RepID=A0A0B5F0L3_STRA4|nr:hypothetical protein SLNWT_7243 [Streptomyces albus]AOU81920.1 hypothetical protein SLNHY_7229 [Streptomyces albus]AYN37605.1 SWF or SNF family helicase [Streptomyces albus]
MAETPTGPGTPQTPETDDGTELVFAPAPPAHGRAFAVSWWGRAWVKALEDTALDSAGLRAGNRLARSGAVGAVSVRPGRLTAMVRDRDGGGHRTDVLLHRFDTAQWDRLLGMAAERAGHVAALLAHEMPHELAEDAALSGVGLLPEIGDLEAECDCGAWDHCAHSTALCYQAARLLDEDPFVLLLLRGLGEASLVAALQERGSRPAAGETAEAGAEAGVDAREAFAAGSILPGTPAPEPVPAAGPQLPSLDTESAPPAPVEAEALSFLAATAAAEARRLLAQALAPGHTPEHTRLGFRPDAVRLLAADPPPPVAARLAAALGAAPEDLAPELRAWREGGASGLRVLAEQWEPAEAQLTRARSGLATAWAEGEAPRLERTGNRWTEPGGERQLRLDEEGRWWPFARAADGWRQAGAPQSDPATALSLTAGDG